MLVIGRRYRSCLEEGLKRYTQEDVFWLPDNPAVDERLAGHADLSVFSGNGAIVVAKGLYPHIVKELTNIGVPVIPSGEQGLVYPKDAGLCVCRTGRYTIYNPKKSDPVLEPYLDLDRIAVNQGYTRCSVCAVSDEAIITADDGISSAASKKGLDVLKIAPGHISLDGYGYGFIGGATVKPSRNTIAFTGVLDEHPDKDRILQFLQKYYVEPVFLTKTLIFDIGGAIALP